MDFDGLLPDGELCQTFTRQGLRNTGKFICMNMSRDKNNRHCALFYMNKRDRLRRRSCDQLVPSCKEQEPNADKIC